MTIYKTEAKVPTAHASKYLQQVCKHWAHNLTVEFDANKGTVIFPKDARGADWPDQAIVTFVADDTALFCQIEASAQGQKEGLKGAIERHIDRFAFREAPLTYDWNA
ncbi:MAG: DUF2218 domain-containing protein [Acidimicrobiales bacterium]|nr:DUF2218 domain-containing protein [Hyphomonadaceae bacterium]RZV44095.1 MAG: DUF2218 domain-containing protein [Acidimicrobiales bacterium]